MLSLAPKQRRSKNWSKGIKHPAWHSRNTPQRARKAGKYLAWPLTNCSNSSNTFFFRRYENCTPFTIICATHTLPCYYHTSLDLVVFLLTVLTRCPICQEDGCLKMAMRPVPVQITTFARKSVSICGFSDPWNFAISKPIRKYVSLQNLMASSRWCPWRTFTGVV